MDLSIFATDRDKELNGCWMEVEFRGQTGKFKIARAGNDKFHRIFAKLKSQKLFKKDQEEEERVYVDDCMTRAMAEAMLMDTGTEITNNGEPVIYTPEIGYQILMAYPELRNQISILASNFEEFAANKLEESTKNS